MKVRILGCGPSNGIPSLTLGFGYCDPTEPKNARTRTSALVYADDGKHILIDSGPEVRLQLIQAGNPQVDAVLFTHSHYDHMGGADDLRFLARDEAHPLHLYMSAQDKIVFDKKFDYLSLNPLIIQHIIEPLQPFEIGQTKIMPVAQEHGDSISIGYRLNALGYVTDAKTMPDESFEALANVDTLVLGLISPQGNYKHIGQEEAFEWIKKIAPRQVYLTHMGYRMDYASLCKSLPKGIAPAYDGLEFEID